MTIVFFSLSPFLQFRSFASDFVARVLDVSAERPNAQLPQGHLVFEKEEKTPVEAIPQIFEGRLLDSDRTIQKPQQGQQEEQNEEQVLNSNVALQQVQQGLRGEQKIKQEDDQKQEVTTGEIASSGATIDSQTDYLNVTSSEQKNKQEDDPKQEAATESIATRGAVTDSQTDYLNATKSPYAYVFIAGGCNPEKPETYQGYLYNILIAASILREQGSTSDIVAIIQITNKSNATSLPSHEESWLQSAGVRVRYMPKQPDENFFTVQMSKFQILNMTEYRRVMFLDCDVMPMANLDYFFHLSDGPNPLLKPNVILAGNNVPFNGGYFMFEPKQGRLERVHEILHKQRVDAYQRGILFDEHKGFGHPIEAPDYWSNRNGIRRENWTWYAAQMDQGFGYHWAKYEAKNVTILMAKHAENWGAYSNGTVYLENTVNLDEYVKPMVRCQICCRKFRCDHAHFDGAAKPWVLGPPEDGAYTTKENSTSLKSHLHLWFYYLSKLNETYSMGLNFTMWGKTPHRPLKFNYKGFQLEQIALAAKKEGIYKKTKASSSTKSTSYQTKHTENTSSDVVKASAKNVLGRFEPIEQVKSQVLTDLFLKEELGWEKAPPEWVTSLCPEVVEHYDKFPSFKRAPVIGGFNMPVGTTLYAAESVCTLSVVKQLAASVGANLYLYAGAHLAAVLHGQPIPWDDDVDAFVPFWALQPLLKKCGEGIRIHQTAHLRCHQDFNAIKLYVDYDGMEKTSVNSKRFQYKSPFIDLFAYNVTESGNIREVYPSGKGHRFRYAPSEFFPTQPFYYGGIYVMGPKPEVALKRYKASRCTMGTFNHNTMRQIGGVVKKFNTTNMDLDCARMSEIFPFVYRDNTIRNRNSSRAIFPPGASIFNVSTNTSISQRLEWFKMEVAAGQNLTDNLPGLNEVEVDNTIANSELCSSSTNGTFKVATYNAARGTFWLEAVDLLREADIIILNEMDIGLARSGQQHTTRNLAYTLGMNYAWGLVSNERDYITILGSLGLLTALPSFYMYHILGIC